MSERPSGTELWWIPVVLAAAAAIYLPGLDNQPIFDDAQLADGTLFAQYASLSELRPRMLSYGSFVWVRELFGDGWWKQRLVNLGLHLAVVAALWAFYREILRHVQPSGVEASQAPLFRSPALGIGVGVFALNPVATYGVAYLIQRSIVMATLFVALALWAFARGLRTRRPLLFAAATACFVLAVMSKEHAVLAPLAAIPVYILVSRPAPARLAVLGGISLALIGAASALLAVRYGEILGKPFDEFSNVYLAQLERLSPGARDRAWPLSILNQTWLFFEYGLRWVMPASGWLSINLRPAFPLTYASFPHVLGPLLYLAVLAGGFALLLRYRDWRALAGLAFLLPALLFPTEFATVWVQDPFVLYRSYLWALGIPGLVFLLFHGPPPRILAGIGGVLAIALAWQAFGRVESMANPERVWTDAIAKLGDDRRAVGRWFPYLNRGAEYTEQNHFQLALRDFAASEQLGDVGMGAFNTGVVLSRMGEHRQALAAFDRAERQGYDLYNLPVQRGMSHLALGENEAAYRLFRAAAALDPPSPTREFVLLRVGSLGLQLGRREEAVPALQELVGREPGHNEGRYLLSMAYVMEGRHEEARAILDGLIRDDRNPRAYYARAVANFNLKRKAEALADIEAAVQLDPRNADLQQWRARIQAMP